MAQAVLAYGSLVFSKAHFVLLPKDHGPQELQQTKCQAANRQEDVAEENLDILKLEKENKRGQHHHMGLITALARYVHLGCLRHWIRGRLNLSDRPLGSYFYRPDVALWFWSLFEALGDWPSFVASCCGSLELLHRF